MSVPTASPKAPPVGRRRRRTWPKALRGRNFRLWYAGQTLSVFGTEMVPVALTFAVLGRYHTAGAVGTVLTAETAPMVLLLLVGGVAADRVSRRSLLFGTDVVSAATQAVAALLLFWGHWQLWQLAVVFAVQGGATGLASPALLGMVADTVPEPHRHQANSLRTISMAAGGVAGPALAGVIAGFGSGGLALAVNAATYAASAACLAAMTASAPAGHEGGGSYLRDLQQGWREFRSRAWVWSIVAQFGVFHLLVLPPVLVLGAVVSDDHLGGAAAWGATLGAFGLGSVAGGLAMLRWHPRRPLLTAVLLASVFTVLCCSLALVLAEPWQVVTGLVAGASFSVFDVLWNTALTTHIPPQLLSRVSAYDWFGSIALLPIGYAIVGPLSVWLGVRTTLWLAAGLWLVLSALVLLVREVRDMPSLEPAGDGPVT
ncbi:MAG TPA: MFS transporter [Mycobacteriales bacterium]